MDPQSLLGTSAPPEEKLLPQQTKGFSYSAGLENSSTACPSCTPPPCQEASSLGGTLTWAPRRCHTPLPFSGVLLESRLPPPAEILGLRPVSASHPTRPCPHSHRVSLAQTSFPVGKARRREEWGVLLLSVTDREQGRRLKRLQGSRSTAPRIPCVAWDYSTQNPQHALSPSGDYIPRILGMPPFLDYIIQKSQRTWLVASLAPLFPALIFSLEGGQPGPVSMGLQWPGQTMCHGPVPG